MNEKQKKIRLMKRWIAALRSGKYEQGKGGLFRDGKYCCLGVLCDISKKEFGLEKREEGFASARKLHLDYLPSKIRDYLELNLKIDKNGFSFSEYLISMNDGEIVDRIFRSRTFEEIANYIEKNILPILESQ